MVPPLPVVPDVSDEIQRILRLIHDLQRELMRMRTCSAHQPGMRFCVSRERKNKSPGRHVWTRPAKRPNLTICSWANFRTQVFHSCGGPTENPKISLVLMQHLVKVRATMRPSFHRHQWDVEGDSDGDKCGCVRVEMEHHDVPCERVSPKQQKRRNNNVPDAPSLWT